MKKASREDLERLNEAINTGMPFHVAATSFLMFDVNHIHELYNLSMDQRERMTQDTASKKPPTRSSRSSAQRQKMIDIATDPSNR
jgi:hypothetical protein